MGSEKREYELVVKKDGRNYKYKWDGVILPLDDFAKDDLRIPELNIKDYFVTQIPESIAEFSNCLSRVNLSGNDIKELPECFGQLVSLVHLDLSDNIMQYIPETFSELVRLETLILKGNHIDEILCDTMPSIVTLDFNRNNLKDDLDKLCLWEKLEIIDIAYNRLSEIPETFEHLKHVKYLNLSHNNMTYVDPSVLSVESLENLIITNNFISNFELDTFYIRSSLDKVDISHNYLYQLPKLRNLPRLRSIKATNNFINEITDSIDDATSLEQVDLANNVITHFSVGVNLQNLQSLDLSNNLLTTFPKDICNLTHLVNLNINRNSLMELDMSSPFKHLCKLDVSHNRLKRLGESLNQHMLPKLETLDVCHNYLWDIPGPLAHLPCLQRVCLSHNKFVSLPCALKSMPKLKYLHLGGHQDKLVTLEESCFDDFECSNSLEELVISGQGLKRLPQSIRDLTSLIKLEMRDNKLKDIHQSCKKLTKVKYLDIGENEFSSIPHYLLDGNKNLEQLIISGNNSIRNVGLRVSRLQHLSNLELSSCSLVTGSFHSTLCKLTGLKRLILDKNEINKIPNSILQLSGLEVLSIMENNLRHLGLPSTPFWPRLEVLSLSNNMLQNIPDKLVNLTSLTTLDISDNLLEDVTDIPRAFPVLPKIEHVDLSRNRFSELPAHVLETTSLKTLLMSHNRIRVLPIHCVEPKNNLKKLDLSNNQIEELPLQLGQFRRLEYFDVSHNKLTDIPQDLYEGMERLKYMLCSHNQLQMMPEYLGLSGGRYKECDASHNDVKSLVTWRTSAESLSVEHNKLTKLPVDIFDDAKLYNVNIRANNLRELKFIDTEKDVPQTGLRALRVSHNFPLSIHPGLRYLKYLTELELISVGMEILPSDIGDLRYLRKLNVSGNKLRNIPAFITKASHLEDINLSDNEIVDTGVKDTKLLLLEYLRNLNISKNKLTTLPVPEHPDNGHGISGIEEYDVSFNHLDMSSITAERLVKDMHCIKRLNLSNNELKHVPKEIFMHTSLEMLDVSFNHINQIEFPDPASATESKLRELNLQCNRLDEVCQEMACMERLEKVDLAQNQISHLPRKSGVFANLQRLQLVLDDNPILQNASTNDIQTFLKATNLSDISTSVLTVLLHGRHLDAKSKMALYLSQLKPDGLDLIPRICNSDDLDIAHLFPSKNTLHLICVAGQEDLDNDNLFITAVYQYFMHIWIRYTQPATPAIGIVLVDGDESTNTEILETKIHKMTHTIRELLDERIAKETVLGSPHSTKGAIQFRKIYNRVSSEAFWYMPRTAINVSAQRGEEISKYMQDMAVLLCNAIPCLSLFDPRWKKVIEESLSASRHSSLFLKEAQIHFNARNVDLSKEYIIETLPGVMAHLNQTGQVLTLCSSGKAHMICDMPWLLGFLSGIQPAVRIEEVVSSIQSTTGSHPELQKEAVDLMEALCQANMCFFLAPSTYVFPARLPSSGQVREEFIRMGDLQTGVPPNHEDILMTFEIPERCPSAFIQRVQCLVNKLNIESAQQSCEDMSCFKEGMIGKVDGCACVLLFEGNGVGKGKSIIGKCSVKVHLRGKVSAKAYESNLTVGQVYNSLERRELAECSHSDGFSSAYRVSRLLKDILVNTVDRFQFLSITETMVGYRLGKHLNLSRFSASILQAVSRDVGEQWKPLVRCLGLKHAAHSNAGVEDIERQGRSLKEQAYIALMIWSQEQGKKATYQTLIKGLRECDLNLIADQVKRMCKGDKVSLGQCIIEVSPDEFAPSADSMATAPLQRPSTYHQLSAPQTIKVESCSPCHEPTTGKSDDLPESPPHLAPVVPDDLPFVDDSDTRILVNDDELVNDEERSINETTNADNGAPESFLGGLCQAMCCLCCTNRNSYDKFEDGD